MSEEKDKVWTTVLTPLDGKIRIGKPPAHFGNGVLLLLSMNDPKDARQAEVILNQQGIGELIAALQKHLD